MPSPLIAVGAAVLGVSTWAVRKLLKREKPSPRELKMRATKVTPISRVFDRAVVHLSGTATAAGPPGWAPMTRHPCLGFSLEVIADKADGSWGVVHRHRVLPAFTLLDATGKLLISPPFRWVRAPRKDIVINRNNIDECEREFARVGVRTSARAHLFANNRPYFVLRMAVLYEDDRIDCFGRASVEAIGPVQAHRPPPTKASLTGRPGAELLLIKR